MINNLQSAGLGFYVEDTNDKFGKIFCYFQILLSAPSNVLCFYVIGDIPLRELVYRVLDLPPSMRPLVYDFGQLNPAAEEDYIHRIVHNHVRNNVIMM